MRNSRTSRPRLAPSADRIDVSRSRRSAAREQQVGDVRAGDQQQHRRRAAISAAASDGCRRPPRRSSASGDTPIWWFDDGILPPAPPRSPTSRAAPARSRRRRAGAPPRRSPGGSRDRSCIGAQLLRAMREPDVHVLKVALRAAARRRWSPGPAHRSPPADDRRDRRRTGDATRRSEIDRDRGRAWLLLGLGEEAAARRAGRPSRRTSALRALPAGNTSAGPSGAGDHGASRSC